MKYLANDGTEFNSVEECERHEKIILNISTNFLRKKLLGCPQSININNRQCLGIAKYIVDNRDYFINILAEIDCKGKANWK